MGELSGKLQIPRKDPTSSSSSSTAAAAAGFMQEEETQGSSTVEALGSVTRSSSSCIAELAPMGTSRRPRHCNVQTPREDNLPERDSCWQQTKFLAAMCQNVSSRLEEICS